MPNHLSSTSRRQQGIVLPIALIMLVIISFAGLLAARNSTTHEQFSDNMRTNQVARILAEEALRFCERVAMDQHKEGTEFDDSLKQKIETTTEVASEADADLQNGIWNIRESWTANGDNLIVVTPNYGNAEKAISAQNRPRCIIQKMANERYLVTSRGLSADAKTDDSQMALTSGSEVWLQSVLSPRVPIKSANNGLGDDPGS